MTQGSEPPRPSDDEAERRDRRGNLYALEVCFLAIVGVVVIAAFVEALSYKLVSSRTPFVIMVPTIILIALHSRRLLRVREDLGVRARLAAAVRGGNAHLNKVVGFSLWMAVLVAMITVLGHLVAIFLFCVILMRYLAAERWVLTLIVAAAATFFIFAVFEYAFNIELYRGLILRWYLGYRDF